MRRRARGHARRPAAGAGVPGQIARVRVVEAMGRMTLLTGVLLLLSEIVLCEANVEYSIGAFYYGPWHRDPTNEKLHGAHADLPYLPHHHHHTTTSSMVLIQ